jgi:hypothetical protein
LAQYTFQLRGWHAIIAIPFLLGYAGLTMYMHVRTVDDAMRDAIRTELLNEYSGRGRGDVARMVQEAREGAPVEVPPPVVQRDVEFTSIGARGKIAGQRAVARVEVTVDGGPPADGRAVRYFSVSSGLGGVWIVDGESDSYQYFMELWH